MLYTTGMRRLLLLAAFTTGLVHAVTQPSFPPRIDKAGRHLVDSRSKPFLFTADTAWMLFYRLAPKDVELYLNDRDWLLVIP